MGLITGWLRGRVWLFGWHKVALEIVVQLFI
jgi:hypothetical protein